MSTLSPREDEVCRLLCDCASGKAVARTLGIALSTVKTHRRNIYQKLGVKNHAELMKRMMELDASSQRIDSLQGCWLSCFSYERYAPPRGSPKTRYVGGRQVNLEHIHAMPHGYFGYRGKNVCGTRSDGVPAYRHEFHIRVMDRIVVGIWENTNTHNVGCFELHVHPDGQSMYGMHLGNTSNGVVKSGDWFWAKVPTSAPFDVDAVDPTSFQSFAELYAIVKAVRNGGQRIALDSLFRSA